MKRILRIFGLLILLLLAAGILLPIVFKGEILERLKTEINNNVEAKVDFEDIDLSLFTSFPDFSLGIDKLTVDGQGDFEGVRLAEVGNFNLTLGLMSVLTGSEFEIKTIGINDVSVHVIVNKEGKANYDIAKASVPTEEVAEEVEEEGSGSEGEGFKLSLQSYSLNNLDLVYDDQKGKIYAAIKNLDHSGKGDFTLEVLSLQTSTSVEELTVKNGGIAYLNHARLGVEFGVEVDQSLEDEMKLTFGENEVNLNELGLRFEGMVKLLEEDIEMDLAFEALQTEFKSILSLVPAVYTQDFADVKADGKVGLKAMAKGTFNGEKEIYPTFDVKLNVDNASFQYPDLPASVEKIFVDAHVYNKTSNLDGTVIEVPKASVDIAGSPLEARFKLQTPMSDPDFDVLINTDFDLANVQKVVPAQGFDYKGNIKGKVEVTGKMSYIEAEEYDRVKALGNISVAGIELKSDSLPFDVKVPSAELNLTPQYAALSNLKVNLGQSDIAAEGRLDNLIGYAFKDSILKGIVQVSSELLDLNELSGGPSETTPEETTATESDTSAMSVVRIPENLDLTLTSNFQKVIYDNLEINDINGDIALKGGEARLANLGMKLLSGEIKMNGGYNSVPESPEIDMDFSLKNFGFKESFDAFNTIQKLAPIMGTATGTYSTDFHMTTGLNQDMSADLESLLAKGRLQTKGLTVSPKSMAKLADLVKNPSLKTLDIDKVDISFEVKDGRVFVEPFDFKAGSVSATAYGSHGLDQTMDYTMDAKIPAGDIGASNLLGQVGASQGGMIDLAVKIGGTTTDPKVTTSVGDIVNSVIENLTQQVQQKVEETKEEALEKANEEAQKLIDEAERKGDALVAEAEKQANAIRQQGNDAANKVIAESEKQAKAVEDKAKGNFLKEKGAKIAADKIRDEGKAKAQKLKDEANAKADGLVNNAKAQKKKLVEDARTKAKVG